MRNYLLCALAMVALAATAGADDKAKQDPEKPDSYQSMVAEFSKVQREISVAFNAAKTDEQRQKILVEFSQTTGTFASRFLAFAKENPDDPTAHDALVWALTNDRQGDVAKQAVPIFMAKHLDDGRKVVRLCQQLSRSSSPAAKTFLAAVLESSKDAEAQGYAAYGLATAMLGRTGERNKEAEALLARVVKDFTTVANGTLAKKAERDLFEIQNLSIGCEAPQITSEDIDGVEFSLTDYRGKIVVLDFWGNW